MTSQAAPELGQGARTARNVLLGIPPRMFQEARAAPAGAALARASHPQFGSLHAAPGDRVYLCAFANGTLALVGRLTLAGSHISAQPSTMVGQEPLTLCRVDRIVPHDVARDLRAVSGDALRFARVSDYELHPGALLKPFELDSRSAEALESLLTEPPGVARVSLPSQAVVAARRRRDGLGKRSSALAERDRAMLELAETGVVLSEIANRFGISRQRVSQLIRASKRGSEAAGTASTEELLAAHAALVEAWGSAQTAGVKAGATRRIRKIEAVLRERGVEFEPAKLGRPRGQPAEPSTQEELLAAHAMWIEARASAQTRGQRQGATRRIRNIEAALHARGVEFEPAPLARPRGQPAEPSTPEELLAAHAMWIEARASAQTRGQRQGATRRIRNIEAALHARGVEFEPAPLARPRGQPAEPSTPEELLAAHAALVEAWGSAQTAGVKAGATRRIRKIEAVLRERGVEFEPAPLARPRGQPAEPSTQEELLAAHAMWIEARASAQTRGQRQGATRRIRNIEAALHARGVEFEPAPLERPPRRSAPEPSTPEELLAAHAALVEAWGSAQTAGVKAGATRRIRKIEAVLRERGVEFEPAKLGRPRGQPAEPSTPEELLAGEAPRPPYPPESMTPRTIGSIEPQGPIPLPLRRVEARLQRLRKTGSRRLADVLRRPPRPRH